LRTPTLAGIVIAFIILLALFRALEFFRARDRRLPIRRRGLVTDTAYWLFTPFVTKATTRICVAAVVIPFALVAYGKVDRTLLEHGFGPAGRQPLWMQAAAILLLGDFVGYWDILFGTYYMPRDRRPTVFGTDTSVPQGLIGQLAFPFRRTEQLRTYISS